jgi:hypothetical protein
MSDTWAVVAAALGSAFLTTLGAFGLDWIRSRRSRKLAKRKELKDACVLILAGANKVTLKSAAMRTNMFARSGLVESLDIVLHHRKPPDVLEINDYVFSDLGPVLDAQATIWLTGDEALIRGAGDVVLAISEVVEKSSSIPKDRKFDPKFSVVGKVVWRLKSLVPLAPDEQSEKSRLHSVKSLSRQCAIFGQLLRERIGTPDVEAILRSFPGLSGFEQAEPADEVDEASGS